MRPGRALVAATALAGVLLTTAPAVAQAILFNEIAASGSSRQDEDGDLSDWIEIVNEGAERIDLAGYRLADRADPAAAWVFAESVIVDPGQLLVVFVSGKDRSSGGALHTNFRLAAEGEEIFLYDPGGRVVDTRRYPEQVSGVSYGRGRRDGTWVYFLLPTPGERNADHGLVDKPWETPRMAASAGFLARPVMVALEMSPPGTTIRYTTDGSEPLDGSPMYREPLRVDTTTILRAAAFHAGRRFGRVATSSYFFEPPHDVSVVSLATAPENLFDPARGIYANPDRRGRVWERPVSVEIFNVGGSREAQVDAGVRIHGRSTRALPKKSFRLFFRGDYGSKKLQAPLFEAAPGAATEFDQLILRGGRSDAWIEGCLDVDGNADPTCATYLRDRINLELFRRLGQVSVHAKPVALYLNGEYWGLYDLTERIDEEFVRSYRGGGDWDVISAGEFGPEATDGDLEEFDNLMALLRGGDFTGGTDSEQLAAHVDLENAFAYFELVFWGRIRDRAANVRLVRERKPGSRWTFLMWDSDPSLSRSEYLSDDRPLFIGQDVIPRLLGAIFSREDWKVDLRDALRERSRTLLAPDSFSPLVDAFRDEIRAEIPREANRWGTGDPAMWEQAVERLREYGEWRQTSLPRDFSFRFPPLAIETPAAMPLGPVRVALIHAGAVLDDGLARLAARVAAAGAEVVPVAADDADPVVLSGRVDLAVVSRGAVPAAFVKGYMESSLPLVFWERGLLREVVPIASDFGFFEIDSLRRTSERAHPVVAGLPGWALKYLRREARLPLVFGELGSGVEGLMGPGGSASSSPYAVIAADAGSRSLDGRSLRARVIYLAIDDVDNLDGYGALLLDRAFDWALSGSPERPFVRGDASRDGNVDLADAFIVLRYLFRAGEAVGCADAADANDDGRINVGDVVSVLLYMYRGGAIPPPFPAPGLDETADSLRCR